MLIVRVVLNIFSNTSSSSLYRKKIARAQALLGEAVHPPPTAGYTTAADMAIVFKNTTCTSSQSTTGVTSNPDTPPPMLSNGTSEVFVMTEPESAVSTEARLKYVQVDLSRATSPGKPGLMDDTADYAPAVRTCMGPASEPNMAKRRKGTQVLPSSSSMRLAFNDLGRGSNDGTASPPSDASPSWPENTKATAAASNIVPSLTLVCPAAGVPDRRDLVPTWPDLACECPWLCSGLPLWS